MEWECFWVNLREDNKVSESKMAVSESNMTQLKMASIINLSQNEWVQFVLCKWWQPILASVSEFEKKYQDGWILYAQIQDGRIQDAYHHQVSWEWMSLSQIELVWVRVRVEWECFWVNLREDNKGLNPRWQCLNPTWQISRWPPSSSWVRMNEWNFLCKYWEPILANVNEFEGKN